MNFVSGVCEPIPGPHSQEVSGRDMTTIAVTALDRRSQRVPHQCAAARKFKAVWELANVATASGTDRILYALGNIGPIDDDHYPAVWKFDATADAIIGVALRRSIRRDYWNAKHVRKLRNVPADELRFDHLLCR